MDVTQLLLSSFFWKKKSKTELKQKNITKEAKVQRDLRSEDED